MYVSMNIKEPSSLDHDMKISKKLFGNGKTFKHKFGDSHPLFFATKNFKDVVYISINSELGIKVGLHIKLT